MPTVLDGCTLSTEVLVELSGDPSAKLTLSETAWARIKKSRDVVDKIVSDKKTVYGINTGFGKFATTRVENVEQLQVNLIRSHCAGVGNPLPPNRARRLLILRINILAKGHSGIRPLTVQKLLDFFNAGIVPFVPVQGTVGASGDLAPLSHLALGVIGEGKLATLRNPEWRPAADVLKECNLSPVSLKAKEGLALINGTQFIASLGAEAIVRARNIARQADVVAAMTIEALKGSKMAFDEQIHDARLHQGQKNVASRVRSLLASSRYPSEIAASHVNCGKVQDAYSLRCCPQVHGIVNETISFAAEVLTRELNAGTDNPLIFPDAPEESRQVISGGNFHGEYPAKILDFLAIAVTELANISERRIERLNNPHISESLPAFLTPHGGLESGFMISHCTAAALASENKVLCHPSSVDTISTSAAQEDHVSMGGFAARKALKVIGNVEHVLAIELMCASQGIDFRRPLKTTEPLERVHALVRSVCPTWETDRDVSADQTAIAKLLKDNKVWEAVEYVIPTEAKFLLPSKPSSHL